MTDAPARTRLHDLFELQRQSPWLDNLRRSWIADGTLQRHVDAGIRGVTSNPTIFQKAITGATDYDEQLAALVADHDMVDAYWAMVIHDIRAALGVLRPVYDASGGADGFVSLEVAPDLAHDTTGTVAAAHWLWDTVALPNLMVKIPATAEGVPAIERAVAEGVTINVTLIFGLDRYAEVMEAYLRGLERRVQAGAAIAGTTSVASFFISRVDTEVDRRLEAVGTPEALALRGRAAVAQGVIAYELFRSTFTGARWDRLAAAGARVQRPLWASTSTKNESYPDLLYVDSLIGPDTVNTMPDATIDAFLDHGTVARTVDTDVEAAQQVLERLTAVGVDLGDVGRTLEAEGVAAFAKSFDELLQALTDKAATLGPG